MAVRERLDGVLSRPAMEELELAVSEMVAMVTRTATEPALDLEVTWPSDVVRVEVRDGPAEIHPGPGGRVLTLLSNRWGIESRPTKVWAELGMR